MASLPTGTVTFLFTDIEGSTRLAQLYPDSVTGLLERHHAILKSAIEGHGGYIFEIIGDAFCAAFLTVREALEAALEAQRLLAAENWSPEPVRVRMGIGTGTAQVRLAGGHPPRYSGYLSLARVQRVMSAGHGGQILMAHASAELIRGELPSTISLRDLGECQLKGLLSPERLWQVVAPGLLADFPPLQLLSLVGDERPWQEMRQLLEAHPLKLPPFLEGGVDAPRPVFVTREKELARLEHFLSLAVEGRGQLAFITGDPGQGKTALAGEFARRAINRWNDVAVAAGNCDAYTGTGDPYLPFREILALLCGDVQADWEARAINREQASRLWQRMPMALQGVVGTGRDLVATLISGEMLARQASTLAFTIGRGQWLAELDQLVRIKASAPADPGFQQAALFEQYLRVLRHVAQQKPLLLILDDLQWADSGSINLLSHLGKRIQGSRLMILGTYRTTELALGRDGRRHPLEPILNEFKRQFGDIQIDMGESDGRRFVDALIDSEPNHLGENFRATLFRVAGGYPLATVEVLRDLQDRGGIVRDASGAWVEAPGLNWEALPARLEAMIAQRIERLDAHQQHVLKVASVEGETFTAEVVASVLKEEPQHILSLLSQELDRRHHLVRAHSLRQQGGQQLSIYRFQHNLFQRYLFDGLDVVERSNLHRSVGTALEQLYAGQPQQISSQLARQFQEAGTSEQAGDYLVQAGDRARDMYAYQEAMDYYQRAKQVFQRALGERWDTFRQAVLERRIGEILFMQGKNEQALEHLLRAHGYLGRPLPASKGAVALAVLREAARQALHRLSPRLFVRPRGARIGPQELERERISQTLDWITATMDPMVWLLTTLESVNHSEQYGVIQGIAGKYGVLGLLTHMMGLTNLGEYYHRKAAELAEKMQRPEDIGEAHNWLALHQNIRGNWESALEHAGRGAEAYRSHWHMRGWAWAVTSLADAHIHRGDFRSALQNGRELLKSGQERADNQSMCWGFSRQGFALRSLGQLQEAAISLEQAMELARAIPDYQIGVDSGGELGHAYLRLGQLERALDVYEECRRISVEHSLLHSPVLTRYLNGLAEAYITVSERSSEADKADWLSKAQRACADALKQGNAYRPGLSETFMLRGTYEWLAGKPAEASRWWGKSLGLARELKERYDEAITLLEMGLRLKDRGCLGQAEVLLASIGAEWDLARARDALKELT